VQDLQAGLEKLYHLQLQQLKAAHRRSRLKVHQYSEEELNTATVNFSVKIGEGGYGDVYRGAMDAAAVAVKVLRPEVVNKDRQLLKEAGILWALRHPHIVSILGCCPGPSKVGACVVGTIPAPSAQAEILPHPCHHSTCWSTSTSREGICRIG
jgi:serine/threonine protein kinase